jgi:hypothetical protein
MGGAGTNTTILFFKTHNELRNTICEENAEGTEC